MPPHQSAARLKLSAPNSIVENDVLTRLRAFDGEPVALALSGGVDSMALALMMHRAELEFIALTVDHGMRMDSADEAKRVAQVMQKLGVSHAILTIDAVPPEAGKMEWARKERYAALNGYCKTHGIKKLFLAHHQDDQVETFFLNLERGSGVKGLSGMRPVTHYQDIEFVRPLLDVPKADLQAFVQSCGASHQEDPTNQNLDYKRNRLRHMLQETFPDNPDLSGRITQAMEHLAEADALIEHYVSEGFAEVVSLAKDSATLNAIKFLELPALLQRRVLTQCLMALSQQEKPPRSEKVTRVLENIHDQQQAWTLHGVQAKRKDALWHLHKEEKA